MESVPRAKGAIVRPMVEWFAGACGEEALREIGASLSGPVRDEISLDAPALGVLPAGWYSEALASELAEAIVRRAIASDHTDVLKALGGRIVERTLGRFSRAAVEWLATPTTIAASAPIFWRMYHDRGVVEARMDGPASMHARNTGWAEHGAAWCKVVGSSAVRVLELSGCRDARLWVHKCSGGRGECSMVFRWAV
jgi:hypothetical protein